MRLPDDTSRYSHKWKYVEAAAYRLNNNSGKYQVMREGSGKKGERSAKFFEWDEIEQYAKSNDNYGVYTSIFRFDKKGTEGTVLGNLYFDFDSKEDIKLSHVDMCKLRNYFLEFCDEEMIRIYFTGMKGFHIEIEALGMGIAPSADLASTYRYIANDLKDNLELSTLDLSIYDKRRMWRLTNTRHQTSNLYKVPLIDGMHEASIEDIQTYAEEPHVENVPEQNFSLKANEWFREYSYRIEAEKRPQKTTSDLIMRFSKSGTSSLRKVDEGAREFNPKLLLENCHAIIDLWNKAETKHHLDHEERLFLCSILSYTDESLYYLHEILSNCSDYNFEKSSAHIDDWIRRREMGIGGRPYTCRRANEAGVGCGDCSLESKKKWMKVGDSWVETDEETDPSPIRFAYKYNKESRKNGSTKES